MDRFARYLFRNKIIILAYHGFTEKIRTLGIENIQGKHLYAEFFESHLKYLKKYYNVIHIEDTLTFFKGGGALPKNPVIITIDDGYKSNYTIAYPLLKKYSLPAAIFLATDFVDKARPLWVDRVEYALNNTRARFLEFTIGTKKRVFDLTDFGLKRECEKSVRKSMKNMDAQTRDAALRKTEECLGESLQFSAEVPDIYRPLSWDDISAMADSGLISIGSHTRGHIIMSRCGEKEAREEAISSKSIIEERTKRICRLFSYPNGGAGDFNDMTRRILNEAGYACAVVNMPGLNGGGADIFALRRFGMSRATDLAEFKRILSGIARFPGYIRQSFLSLVGR